LDELQFEWDPEKAAKNFRKHRVSFGEAQTVFDDPNGHVEYDTEHAKVEERWRVLGLSNRLRLLSVIYAKKEQDTVRIISARRASAAEKGRYTSQP
jgi:uncharacterized DUF497 family protein